MVSHNPLGEEHCRIDRILRLQAAETVLAAAAVVVAIVVVLKN